MIRTQKVCWYDEGNSSRADRADNDHFHQNQVTLRMKETTTVQEFNRRYRCWMKGARHFSRKRLFTDLYLACLKKDIRKNVASGSYNNLDELMLICEELEKSNYTGKESFDSSRKRRTSTARVPEFKKNKNTPYFE